MKNIFLRRALAYLADVILAFAMLYVLPQTLISKFVWPLIGITQQNFNSGWFTEAYVLLCISLPVWLSFILLDCSRFHGTLGKRLFRLSVLDAENGQPIFFDQSVARTAIKLLPWELAHVMNDLPTPLWYDPNPPPVRAWLMAFPTLLLVVYVVYCFASKGRRTIHDRIAKTSVVPKTTSSQVPTFT